MSGAIGIQDAAAALIVVAAVAWLTRRWWLRRKRGTCTCDGCPVAERSAAAGAMTPPATGGGLVTIDPLGPGPR